MTLSNHLDVMTSNNKTARSLLERLDQLLFQFDGPRPEIGSGTADSPPPAPSFHSMFQHGNTEMESLLISIANTVTSLENSIGVTGTVPGSSFKFTNRKTAGVVIDTGSMEKSLG